jgi:hypothetical protein
LDGVADHSERVHFARLELPDIDAAKLEFLAEESNVLGEVGVLAKLSRWAGDLPLVGVLAVGAGTTMGETAKLFDGGSFLAIYDITVDGRFD